MRVEPATPNELRVVEWGRPSPELLLDGLGIGPHPVIQDIRWSVWGRLLCLADRRTRIRDVSPVADVGCQEEPGLVIQDVPEVGVLSVHIHDRFIDVPPVAGPGLLVVHPLGRESPEVSHPAVDRGMRDSEVLDLSEVLGDLSHRKTPKIEIEGQRDLVRVGPAVVESFSSGEPSSARFTKKSRNVAACCGAYRRR